MTEKSPYRLELFDNDGNVVSKEVFKTREELKARVAEVQKQKREKNDHRQTNNQQ